MSKWFALWFDTYRLDHPMETMSDRKAQERNAEFTKQGIMNLRWRETDLHTSEMIDDRQFCMDCGVNGRMNCLVIVMKWSSRERSSA